MWGRNKNANGYGKTKKERFKNEYITVVVTIA